MVRVYQHMSVSEMDNEGKTFTNHSLHLNTEGEQSVF
jgi:hypothetical protein